KAGGYDIVKTCIANDRGIHICKSMIAWQLFANGATPESTGIKGDHLVGDYYVRFGQELKKQAGPILLAIHQRDCSPIDQDKQPVLIKHLDTMKQLQASLPDAKDDKQRSALQEKIGKEEEEIKDIAENAAPIMKAAQQMLVDWEAGKPDVMELWRTMNSW